MPRDRGKRLARVNDKHQGDNMDVGAVAALGTALTSARIETQFAALALAAQLNTAQDIGQHAIQLIQAATIDPSSGTVLDVQV